MIATIAAVFRPTADHGINLFSRERRTQPNLVEQLVQDGDALTFAVFLQSYALSHSAFPIGYTASH